MARMSYQNEWRIAVYDKARDTAAQIITIDGGIRDIAYMVKSSDIIKAVDELFVEQKIKQGCRECWFGNISRRNMRNKFYELGNNKGVVLGIIG